MEEQDHAEEQEESQEEEAPQLAFEDSDHEGSEMGEHIMQRLRYFENLSEHQAEHIATLSALLVTHGVAPPAMPHFPELKSPVGNHDPN
ncbi:MAG: hypothetical protein AUI15_05885 [Actinobacteria bacterium 13_2_20CM_2_66_6]|nr:MAG: hypothetical protein AUI15_05885 [Actinobacteria bacterium 13_2_20CM_2_66_6]